MGPSTNLIVDCPASHVWLPEGKLIDNPCRNHQRWIYHGSIYQIMYQFEGKKCVVPKKCTSQCVTSSNMYKNLVLPPKKSVLPLKDFVLFIWIALGQRGPWQLLPGSYAPGRLQASTQGRGRRCATFWGGKSCWVRRWFNDFLDNLWIIYGQLEYLIWFF